MVRKAISLCEHTFHLQLSSVAAAVSAAAAAATAAWCFASNLPLCCRFCSTRPKPNYLFFLCLDVFPHSFFNHLCYLRCVGVCVVTDVLPSNFSISLIYLPHNCAAVFLIPRFFTTLQLLSWYFLGYTTLPY